MKNVDNLKYHLQKSLFDDFNQVIQPTSYCIAGGAVRDYFTGDKIKDYDLFLKDRETEDRLLEFLNINAKLLSQNDRLANYIFNEKWVQVIKQQYWPIDTDPQSVIRDFDFTICGALVRGDGGFDCLPTFFQDTLSKHLRTNKLNFPLHSLERMQKYIKKGYTACNGTLLDLAKAINALNLNDTSPSGPNRNTLMFYPDGTPRFVGID